MKQAIRNVYIHLPFCLKKCHFCAFPIHALGQHALQTQHTDFMLHKYISSLKKEIQHSVVTKYKQNIISLSPLQTIYLGGGTPSLFHPSQIQELIQFLKEISQSPQIPEITLELNPEEISRIPDFHSAGINRFSIGIQSFNTFQLRKFNRVTLSQQIKENINNKNTQAASFKQLDSQSDEYMERIADSLEGFVREKKLINYNVDFIVDLNPSESDQERIFKFIHRLKPPHITLYLLEVIEDTYLYKKINQVPFQTKFKPNDQNQPAKLRPNKYDSQSNEFEDLIKGFDKVHDKYIRTSDKLKNFMGYSHYEVSNFALLSQPNHDDKTISNKNIATNTLKDQAKFNRSFYESKHNQVYWKGNQEFVGFGMGASSLLRYSNLNLSIKKSLKSKQLFDQQKLYCNDLGEQIFRITNPKTITKYYDYVQRLQQLSISQKSDTLFERNQFQQNAIEDKNIQKQNSLKMDKNLIEIHLQSFPVGMLQSYILSAIRTQKGILFSQIQRILKSRSHNDTRPKAQQLDQKYQVFIKQMVEIFQKELQDLNKTHHYFEFIYEEKQAKSNSHEIKESEIQQKSEKSGLRLLSPHGYLIADEIGNRVAVLVQKIFG